MSDQGEASDTYDATWVIRQRQAKSVSAQQRYHDEIAREVAMRLVKYSTVYVLVDTFMASPGAAAVPYSTVHGGDVGLLWATLTLRGFIVDRADATVRLASDAVRS